MVKLPESEFSASDNHLALSWHDSNWIPHLNINTILEYFSERSNPFYDRTCNNEIIKMQRVDPAQIKNMTGLEYELLHCQEPILYVIRKQHRHSPTQTTPIADYYILAGYVYQAPDVNSVINSRMLTCMHHLLSAFDEVNGFMRYHPTKGYSWEFAKESQNEKEKEKEREKEKIKEKAKEDHGSAFQRRRVDMLLGDLAKKFPPKIPAAPATDAKAADADSTKDSKNDKPETQQQNTTIATQPSSRNGEPPAKKAKHS